MPVEFENIKKLAFDEQMGHLLITTDNDKVVRVVLDLTNIKPKKDKFNFVD